MSWGRKGGRRGRDLVKSLRGLHMSVMWTELHCHLGLGSRCNVMQASCANASKYFTGKSIFTFMFRSELVRRCMRTCMCKTQLLWADKPLEEKWLGREGGEIEKKAFLSTSAPWWRFAGAPCCTVHRRLQPQSKRDHCKNSLGLSAYCTTSASWRVALIFAYI